MKFVSILALVLLGAVIGRWSVDVPKVNYSVATSVVRNATKECQPEVLKAVQVVKEQVQCSSPKKSFDKKYKRTEAKKNNKKIQKLFGQILKAKSNDDLEAQNEFFEEMVALNPKHHLVFQMKSMFLDEDGDWEGSYENLKACVEANPRSVYCHRRIANIRSSSIEDKIKHGKECLNIKPDSQLCLVDLANAYDSDGQHVEAKRIYEKVLELPEGPNRFDRRYVLFRYGLTLEELSMEAEAADALGESCELKFKPACRHLDKRRSATT